MRDGRPPPLDYGVQKSPPDAIELKQRLKRLFILFGIAWFVVTGAVLVYKLIVNDPAD